MKYPEFLIKVYDTYDNVVDKVPDDWKLGLYFSG